MLFPDLIGVWILHCHIGWHLGAGFAGVIVMQPSVLKTRTLPTANQALCSGATAANIDTIEPGRRKRSSIMRPIGYQILNRSGSLNRQIPSKG